MSHARHTLNSVIGGAAAGPITIFADRIDLSSGTPTVQTPSYVIVSPNTDGRTIDIGGADSATSLGLTDAELDRITAGNILHVGYPGFNFPISVTAAISSSASYPWLALNTSNAITQSAAGSLAVVNLTLQAGTGIGTAIQSIQTSATNL